MYATQCFPFVGSAFAIPISGSNGPSLKRVPKSLKDKDERICCGFIFEVA